MSDALSPLATVVAATAAQSDQMVQLAILQQKLASDQAAASLIQQAVQNPPAPLPEGQGGRVDVSA